MKVAVVQHALRESAAEDARALIAAVNSAQEQGAELVVLPQVPAIDSDPVARWTLDEAVQGLSPVVLIPAGGEDCEGAVVVVADLLGDGRTGAAGVLVGDAAFSAGSWEHLLGARVHTLVVNPGSENELQAEAVLELALALSASVAGLVLVAECDGAGVGEEGHGGSAIISLGEVVAEALEGDDVLVAEIATPIAQPEPREPLPELPTLLSQRVANHHGAKLAVDYPADLSDGAGPS